MVTEKMKHRSRIIIKTTTIELATGKPVWARMGGYGWRPAIVAGVGRKFVHLDFLTGKQPAKGRRLPEELSPRNPELQGKDKPAPCGCGAESDGETCPWRS